MRAKQLEVHGFLPGYADPVDVELFRQLFESPHNVDRQIDGIQFDMSQRVDQRRASWNGAHGALFQRCV